MSWIATIVFCTLALTCAGCMLTLYPPDPPPPELAHPPCLPDGIKPRGKC